MTSLPSRPPEPTLPGYVLVLGYPTAHRLADVDEEAIATVTRTFGALLCTSNQRLASKQESNRLAPTRALALPYEALASSVDRRTANDGDRPQRSWESQFKLMPLTQRLFEDIDWSHWTPQPIDWDSVEVVSWDLDGTLYALRPMIHAFRGHILRDLFSLRAWGTARALFRLWRRLTTMGKVRKRGGIEGLPTPDKASSIKAQMVRWHSESVGDVGAQPGVIELLKAIEAAGRRQIVVTDYEAKEKLDALALPVRFEHVFEGEVIGAIKPSPVMFETILSQMAIAPKALLHIGDRDESDGIAARKAGCQVVILGKDFADFDALHRQLLDVS